MLAVVTTAAMPQSAPAPAPRPPGVLVDIGGAQQVHVNCSGQGTPTVVFENGTGDFSMIWALVQARVASVTRACSYDRGGYAWSDPGRRPRTFAQLSLELHTALHRLGVEPPYVLVGQSYGGLVIRGFAREYANDVAGMVLVDAVHEDQQVVYGGQPHRIRESAAGRPFPPPSIARDDEWLRRAADAPLRPEHALESPLDRLPNNLQQLWRWAEQLPLVALVQSAETDWSPEELARMHQERLDRRATLGRLPLVVLARTNGGYADGMSVSATALEEERRALQLDLSKLSSTGTLRFAASSGHNIHLEDPEFVFQAILDVVKEVRTAGRARS